MTTEEAIHRAALRKHRHKGNYIATHEALLAEAEYLQQTNISCQDCKFCGPEQFGAPGGVCFNEKTSTWSNVYGRRHKCIALAYLDCELKFFEPKRRSLWQIIKGWFA